MNQRKLRILPVSILVMLECVLFPCTLALESTRYEFCHNTNTARLSLANLISSLFMLPAVHDELASPRMSVTDTLRLMTHSSGNIDFSPVGM